MTQSRIDGLDRYRTWDTYSRSLKNRDWANKHRIELYWRKRDLEEEPL